MATIHFFTRTITKDKNALVPVYVRLKSGRKIDLCCKADVLIKPDNWSNKTQQAMQRANGFKIKSEFNDKIAGLRAAIEHELMNVHQEDITSDWLKIVIDKHWHPDKYTVNLFSFIEQFIKNSETKIHRKTGRPVSYKMRREYQVSFDYLKGYAAQTGKPLDFKDIDLDFYDKYTQFLQNTKLSDKSEKKIAVNTIGKKIQTLKIFLNAAQEEGLNTNDKFKSSKFVAISEEAETIYLNESELETLYKYDLSNRPGLDRVRDLFLVGCWTGCRFSDIPQITPESISDGLIHMKQYKTGNKVVIPLHPVVTAIINKYGGTLPEPISNQKFNEDLKVIADEAGINDITHKAITRGGLKTSKTYKKSLLVTTHTARRSFATNLYKSGFPSLSIMAITGHKTEGAFLKYIKVTPDEHAKKLQVHWDNRHLKVV